MESLLARSQREEREMDDLYRRYLEPPLELLALWLPSRRRMLEAIKSKEKKGKETEKEKDEKGMEKAKDGDKDQKDDSIHEASSETEVVESKPKSRKMFYWLELDISCEGLMNPFSLGLPDVFVEIYRIRGHLLERVCRSETYRRSVDPHFRPIIINASQLCNMQPDRQIVFKVWSTDRFEGRILIGECVTSLSKIQTNLSGRFPVVHPKKYKMKLQAMQEQAERESAASSGISVPVPFSAANASILSYRNSGYLRFQRAEFCINATKASLAYARQCFISSSLSVSCCS